MNSDGGRIPATPHPCAPNNTSVGSTTASTLPVNRTSRAQAAKPRWSGGPSSGAVTLLAFCTLFFIAGIAIQIAYGAFRADRGLTADESAHFVTSVMLTDFISGRWFRNPMAFALGYYGHFPRVAIGHWPPFFHAVQGLYFLVTGTTVAAALVFQAMVAGLACGIPATLSSRRWGVPAGMAAGLLTFCSPAFLFLINAVMIDNMSGLLVLLAALSWAYYWQKLSFVAALLFVAAAICSTMTKGNALGLALVPLLHCILSRDFKRLRLFKTWAIAAMVGAVVIPWYVLTYKLTADGFNYSFGWEFTSAALPSYARICVQMLGVPAILGFLIMALHLARTRPGEQDAYLTALLSAVLAILIWQMIAPADIQARYMLSALPAATPLAVGGIVAVVRATRDWAQRRGMTLGRFFVDGCVTLAVLVSIFSIYRAPYTRSFGMDKIAAAIEASGAANPVVLLCVSPVAEGAAIAAFAALEHPPAHYLVRGTQALSASDFMGNEYRPRFFSTEELKRWLGEHHIGWIILDDSADSVGWAHNRLAMALARNEVGNWHSVATVQRGDGSVRLYALPDSEAAPPDIDRLLREIRPQKLLGVGGWRESAGPGDRSE